MADITPVWTEQSLGVSSLARGSSVRFTLDMRTKHRGYILVRLGRGGTAALTNGVNVFVRRTYNNDAALHVGPIAGLDRLSLTAAANATTVNVDSNSGQAELKVAAITGWAVGDILCIQGASQARLEWARIAKLTVGSGTGVTLDANLKFSHTSAQADSVRNKSDVFDPFPVEGGSTIEVILDYSDDAAGDAVTYEVLAQTLDKYQSI